ncbi:escargot-like protein [Euroglyphus maynei]|uniref:Escargot-like protein n=1 Tax=Euroglyphus maynei TaxID=6958 RepID=A0A1Y3BMA9_EURMA|nr:escargot-like protein [Euroglyphus maynei]
MKIKVMILTFYSLDLSIKSLLKESNSSSSTFVSSYPYPAKFAKIADFLRTNLNESSSSSNKPHQQQQPVPLVTAVNTRINEAIDYSVIEANKSQSSSSVKPINYSRMMDEKEESSSIMNHYERMPPYSINWSEHFSVNRIIVSPNSQRSDDSGRESIHSASDDFDMKIDNNNSTDMNHKTNSQKKSDRYHCPDCNKSYSTQSGLAKHQEFLCTSQVKKSFSCKHCEKVYVSLGALKMHIRTHTLPCKCKLCGKAFSRPWLLQGHIRTHTGEKPFACQFCNRAFADRSNLRAHLQTHSVVKKYSCKTCSRTFSRMSLLLKHEDNGNCCNNIGGTIHQHHQSTNPLVSIQV